MNSHPYARAIPSAFYSNTQAVIHANRRIPDDSIMPISYAEMRAKSSQILPSSQRTPPPVLIVSKLMTRLFGLKFHTDCIQQHKSTPRPGGKIDLEGEGVKLILGGQEDYAQMPSYGRCAVVDGILKLENPRDVLRVEAKVNYSLDSKRAFTHLQNRLQDT